MSTIDTSTWNPDPALNESIGDIPLNADASIQQTWQAIQMLMAALKGDTAAIELTINQPDGTTIVATNQTLTVVDNGHAHTIANVAGLQTALNGKAANASMTGATSSADGASGLVPKPEAGDENKVLKGDGTWGSIPSPNLGTTSRAVQTDANGALAVSSITATELGYLSGVTSAVQTQINAKAADSTVVHLAGTETIAGAKTFSSDMALGSGKSLKCSVATGYIKIQGGTADSTGARIVLSGASRAGYAGQAAIVARDTSTNVTLLAKPDGTLTWGGQAIQTSSDERLKTPLAVVPNEVLDAWEDVGWGQFQFLDAVKRKGEAARLHLGLIAQKVKTAFESHGLDACAYGILCHEVREVAEEDPVVDLWMVRYEEALAMEAAYQRRRADRLEARIAALEEAMNV